MSKISNRVNKAILRIIIIGLAVVGAIWGYKFFGAEKALPHEFITVTRGNIVEEVSETGKVKVAEEIALGFQNPGKVEKVYVKVGQEVGAGQSLAKLDTGQLEIQLAEAEATLELAQAKLNQLLAGTSEEEIKWAETSVLNAETALANAGQNLEDVKAGAEILINQAYEDAVTTLDNSYLKLSNAFNTVSAIQRTYFARFDHEGLQVKENKENIESALKNVKLHIEIAKSDSRASIDTALAEMKSALDVTAKALEIVRDITETLLYRNEVSSADKTSLDTERANIDTGLTNIVNSQQTISSTKLTNETNINTARAKVDSAGGQLQSARDTLTIKRAGPRLVDIDLYNVQIKQARAKVDLLKEQIAQSLLKSPIQGVVTQINKKAGETAQITDSVISLISSDDFQIEVDIYEEDIVRVKVNDPVDITLTAFPEKTLKGKIISIDPAEKLIKGVVYYEANIAFNEKKEGIKAGMTVDLVIQTASKSNVLIIPEDAVRKKNGQIMVQVFKDGLIQDREIEIGLRGSDDRVEVVSGLEEGEEVIIN